MIIKLIVILFTLYGIKVILFDRNGIANSFKWIILAFILGYRTFTPFAGLKIHPIEIFIYSTIIRIIISGVPKYRDMPKSILVLSILFISYFFIDLLTRYNSIALIEFKNASLLFLIFFIAQYIVFNKKYIIDLFKNYLIAATLISILGIIEYLFEPFMESLFGFQGQGNINANSILFSRLAFLYWGSHLAANLIPPVFPIILLLKSENDKILVNNFFLTFLIIINLVAIYLSGNRISWLILTIYLIILLFQFKNSLIPYLKLYILVITTSFILYIYSQPVEGRYVSTFKALVGNIDIKYDSSGGARIIRAKNAISSIIDEPFGTGWGSQGWVHSDVLQMASSIGIIPGLIFLIVPILLLYNLYKNYNSAEIKDKAIFFTCFGTLVYVIISFILNGNILKVQTGVPLFILWMISQNYYQSNNQISKDYGKFY